MLWPRHILDIPKCHALACALHLGWGVQPAVREIAYVQAGMDLTGMSPFRNAHYTPSVPVQHGMYGQVPAVQNGYLEDMGQVGDCPLSQASSCHDAIAACGRTFPCCLWPLRVGNWGSFHL